jgi:hypothetical protein
MANEGREAMAAASMLVRQPEYSFAIEKATNLACPFHQSINDIASPMKIELSCANQLGRYRQQSQ